jgi:AraC family transcriptional regulator
MNFVKTGSCIPVHSDQLLLLANLRKLYAHRFEPAYNSTMPGVLLLQFVTRGEQLYQTGDTLLRVRPNCFLLLNPGSSLHPVPGEGNDHSSLTILFPSALIGDLFKNSIPPFPYLFNSLYEMTPLAQHILQPFLKEKEIQDDEQLLKAYLGVSELLLYCQQLNASRVNSINAARLETKEELFGRLQQAGSYILSRFETITSIAEVAKACSLSQSLLTKHYARVFGFSPKQHIIQLKLDYAKQLLQTTHMPVTDIVNHVGFINTSSFIRLFRSFTGMTPRRYRLQPRASNRVIHVRPLQGLT